MSRCFGFDLDLLPPITNMPLPEHRKTVSYSSFNVATFKMDFSSNYSLFEDRVLFLQPFKLVSMEMNKFWMRDSSKRHLWAYIINMNFLTSNLSGDTLLMECFWDTIKSNSRALKVSSVLYNVSKKEILNYPSWYTS